MQERSRIYIAGHTGLIGSAIRRKLEALGCHQLVLRTWKDLDLTRQQAVEEFFAWEHLDYVFFAPASIEYSAANESWPADFLSQNLAIQSNILNGAYQAGVKRLLFLDSSCVYPHLMPRPTLPEGALARQLQSFNRVRAIAKSVRIEMCNAFNRQRGCRFLMVRPPSLYGPRDTYHAYDYRTVPAMIRRMHWAKVTGERDVVLRGPSDLRREFVYSDDLADACIFLMSLHDHQFELLVSGRAGPLIHVGAEDDLALRDLAELVAEAVMFRGKLQFDTHRLESIPRRQFDGAQTAILRTHPQMDIREGLQWAYNDFLSQIQLLDRERFEESLRPVGHDEKQLSDPECRSRRWDVHGAASLSLCLDAPILR